MIKNKISYLKFDEYNELLDEIKERVACSNRIKNIYINEQYSNVKLSRLIFDELGIKREVADEMEHKLDALYDYLSDIPLLLETKILAINIFIEDKENISKEMFIVLKNLQKFLGEEIVECGSEDDFPMSFDLYIKFEGKLY